MAFTSNGVIFLFSWMFICIGLGLAQDDPVTTEATTPTTKNTTSSTIKTTTQTPEPIITVTTPAPPKPDGDEKAPVNTYHFQCMLVKMAVKLNFTYNETYQDKNETKYRSTVIQWNIPNNFTVENSSSCNSSTQQELVIRFFKEDWKLKMVFMQNASKNFNVSNVILTYLANDTRFRNISNESTYTVNSTKSGIRWDAGTGFKCSSDQSFADFSNTEGAVSVLNNMHMSDVQIEAFRSDASSTTFGKSVTDCTADTTVSNIVPIAVGAALAGLVLIVLIAYLIGRRRNKRGYESV